MAFLIDHYMALRAPQTLYPNIKKKKINSKNNSKMYDKIWLFKKLKKDKLLKIWEMNVHLSTYM